jgi:hypothetical protein
MILRRNGNQESPRDLYMTGSASKAVEHIFNLFDSACPPKFRRAIVEEHGIGRHAPRASIDRLLLEEQGQLVRANGPEATDLQDIREILGLAFCDHAHDSMTSGVMASC